MEEAGSGVRFQSHILVDALQVLSRSQVTPGVVNVHADTTDMSYIHTRTHVNTAGSTGSALSCSRMVRKKNRSLPWPAGPGASQGVWAHW
jgi:hypothetical protein